MPISSGQSLSSISIWRSSRTTLPFHEDLSAVFLARRPSGELARRSSGGLAGLTSS